MNKEICPIMSKPMYVQGNSEDTGLWDIACREGECALWTVTREYEGCAYTVQALVLNDLMKIYAERGPI